MLMCCDVTVMLCVSSRFHVSVQCPSRLVSSRLSPPHRIPLILCHVDAALPCHAVMHLLTHTSAQPHADARTRAPTPDEGDTQQLQQSALSQTSVVPRVTPSNTAHHPHHSARTWYHTCASFCQHTSCVVLVRYNAKCERQTCARHQHHCTHAYACGMRRWHACRRCSAQREM